MAAGMLLSTVSLLHAKDNPIRADEGTKYTGANWLHDKGR